jgi:hypothetical protein
MLTTDFTAEKSELESVLASGIFERAPSLAQLLTYVCQKHFEGPADEIKEYNIAVDALGRPVQFDPKRDSIVRVQFYRLRDRLADYYRREGSSHSLRIVIPQGQYVPKFVQRSTENPKIDLTGNSAPLLLASTPPTVPESEPKLRVPPEPPAPATGKSRVLWFYAAAVLLLAAAALPFAARHFVSPTPAPLAMVSPVSGLTGTDSIRILAGLKKGVFTDGFGHVWQPDQ